MKRTDKTLFEQLRINEAEMMRRKELLDITAEDIARLKARKVLIEAKVDEIVDEFYTRQTELDEIALLIGDADTLNRLRVAQRKYIIDLFSGNYDSEYVNNRLRIGLVHKRIGVEPKLYLSAVRTLKALLFQVVEQNIADLEEYNQLKASLDKLLYFDVTLVFDTYIDSLVEEIGNAKRRTEIYAASLEQKVQERTAQLEQLTKLDPLTELYNRRAMQDILLRELQLNERYGNSLALAYMDLDHFKGINDKYGHIRGDEVLKGLASSIKLSIRKTDIPCRYGGDEFCLIFPQCTVNQAVEVCEKIMAEFTRLFPHFTISVGVVCSDKSHSRTMEELIKLADEKMYRAKKSEGVKILAS